MFDNEHSLTTEDVDAIEHRLRNLSLRLLPQLVERDLPRLLNEVRTLHSILFMNQFTNTLQNGVDANGTEAEKDSVQGEDQESTGDSQDGGRDRTSGGDVAGVANESVSDSAGTRQPSRIHSGRAANKKRNRKRRRRNK
jgi:hypothetical protein